MMHAYERLGKLINGVMQTPEKKTESFFVGDFENFREVFILESANIEKYLTREALSINDERVFELKVHRYQGMIISWLDEVTWFQSEEKAKYPAAFYQFIVEELQKLLSHITDHFGTFFNYDEKVPQIYLQACQKKLKGRFNGMVKHLVNESVNPELLAIVLFPIREFLNPRPSQKICYGNELFIKKYMYQLSCYSKEKHTGVEYENKALLQLMVYLNFNYPGIVSYVIRKIVTNLNTAGSPDKKVKKLSFYLKEINQFEERKGMCYKPHCASLKEQLTKWIEAEICYHEKKIKMFSMMPDLQNEDIAFMEEKLHVSVSVEVLTLLARAAKETNFVLNKHSTEMFRHISKYFRTVNADNLSVKSMVKKSYVAGRNSKETAIDVLHEMIRRIHGY